MPKAKAYWKGHEIIWTENFSAGYALILYYDDTSFFTGKGKRWVPQNEIVLEAE